MISTGKKETLKAPENENAEQEKNWDNPVAPEQAEDERDIEQMKRQKKEAERRKENLTGEEN